MRQTSSIALPRDYWTSVSNHSYLGLTSHYFYSQWELRLHVLTVMKIEERLFADAYDEHFIQVGRQWNIELKVSTLTTDSA